MLFEEVNNYISTAKGLPFFYFVGDGNYAQILQELSAICGRTIKMSDFCKRDDKFPSIDDLIDEIRTSDVDYKDNRIVVVGVGEYLALKGKDTVIKELSRLKNTTLGNSRVIFLLKGISSLVSVLSDDRRIFEQQRLYVSDSLNTNITITNIGFDNSLPIDRGIKKLLSKLEEGTTGNIVISTMLNLKDSMFPVTNITSAYRALTLYENDFHVDECCGTPEQWETLLQDYTKYNNSLRDVFIKHRIDDSIDSIYKNINGIQYKNWLYFILLKQNIKLQKNSYLQYVLEKTTKFEELKNNLLTGIIDVSHLDSRFETFYDERKRLVKDYSESEVAIFIHKNGIDPKESIYKYTDNTLIERKAILSWVSNYGWIEEINHIYPALADYMKKYVFSTTVLQQELTDYFEEYKKQKITNKINPQFLEIVNDNAKSYKYAKLPTRNSVINGIKDKNSVHLHWVDALGVEYLSFITEIARKKGISLQVEIARADLPTITVINKSFYDNWTGKSKEKEERLDEIKHKQQGGYLFTDSKEPIHLAAELGIIEEVMQKAETSLAMRECSKFVIASDHGASRLAVIKEQEVKYETDTKGEHSGRCCKYFDGCDLEYCIPENEYLVLSDYGRFKGSRKANVEVHGGATWEEIIVPIITLSLKNQEEVEIKVLDADNIFIEKNKGVLVKVYISDTSGANEVAIVCEGKKYIGQKEDATHYNFCISGIKRAKKYKATVYNGDDLIGEIEFTAKSKTGSVNTEFDDLF